MPDLSGLYARLLKAQAHRTGIRLDYYQAQELLSYLEDDLAGSWGRNKDTVHRVYETRIDCLSAAG